MSSFYQNLYLITLHSQSFFKFFFHFTGSWNIKLHVHGAKLKHIFQIKFLECENWD